MSWRSLVPCAVLCWIMTTPEHRLKKLQHVHTVTRFSTWARRAPNISEGRSQLYWKTVRALPTTSSTPTGSSKPTTTRLWWWWKTWDTCSPSMTQRSPFTSVTGSGCSFLRVTWAEDPGTFWAERPSGDLCKASVRDAASISAPWRTWPWAGVWDHGSEGRGFKRSESTGNI